jgi:hypothetical protein
MDQNDDLIKESNPTNEIKLKSENEVIFFLCLFSYLNIFSRLSYVENSRKVLLNMFSIELSNF